MKEALASVDPVPFSMRYGQNFWAGVKAHPRQGHRNAGSLPQPARVRGMFIDDHVAGFIDDTNFRIHSLRLLLARVDDLLLGDARPLRHLSASKRGDPTAGQLVTSTPDI
jgi:hypothetical protein